MNSKRFPLPPILKTERYEERKRLREVNTFRTDWRHLSVLALMDVSGQVLREVVCPREAFAAHLTMVRALSSVDPKVSRQVTLTPKCTPTKEASKRTLSGVFPHMELEVLLRPNTFATERASERSWRPLPFTELQQPDQRRFSTFGRIYRVVLIRTFHLPAYSFVRACNFFPPLFFIFFLSIRTPPRAVLNPLKCVVQPMLLERLEVSELHSTNIACE